MRQRLFALKFMKVKDDANRSPRYMIMVKKAETTLTDLGFTPEESHTIIKIGVIRTPFQKIELS